MPPVRISACEIVAQKASSGIRNTHRSMYKCLDFQILRNIRAQLFDFFQRQLSGGNHAARALFIPEIIGSIVCIVCLSTDMSLNLRTHFFAISNTPGSAIIRASGLISLSSSKYLRTPGRSSLCARILAVTYTFTSCSCANAIPFSCPPWKSSSLLRGVQMLLLRYKPHLLQNDCCL